MRPPAVPAVVLALYGLFCLMPGGLNLCIHRDGHMRLESAAFPCCGDGEGDAPAREHPPGPGADTSSCADCVDIPMPSSGDSPRPAPPDRPRLPEAGAPALAIPFAHPGDRAPGVGRSSPGEVPRGSLPGILLASVVLRC